MKLKCRHPSGSLTTGTATSFKPACLRPSPKRKTLFYPGVTCISCSRRVPSFCSPLAQVRVAPGSRIPYPTAELLRSQVSIIRISRRTRSTVHLRVVHESLDSRLSSVSKHDSSTVRSRPARRTRLGQSREHNGSIFLSSYQLWPWLARAVHPSCSV